MDADVLLAEPEWADKAARLAAETGLRLPVVEDFTPREPLDPTSANTAATVVPEVCNMNAISPACLRRSWCASVSWLSVRRSTGHCCN